MAGCGQKAVEIAGTKEETEKKTIAIGVTFAPGNLDPAQNYNGWYVVTYGIGEALVKTGKDMKLEPWLTGSSGNHSGSAKGDWHQDRHCYHGKS
ncbi:hypothetical protein [Desulfoscipio geothermicus]|nr:hypothetical protein [Desulfoscipio geothermicus]